VQRRWRLPSEHLSSFVDLSPGLLEVLHDALGELLAGGIWCVLCDFETSAALPQLPAPRGSNSRDFLTRRLVPRLLDLGTRMVTWQIPAPWRDSRRRPRYGRFMSTPRAIGLLLMVAGGCVYGTAPDWLALSVGLLGLAATFFADLRYLRRAIARRHFSFLIDRAILLMALAAVAVICLFRLVGSGPA
jgi:hypothetical protein